MANRSLCFFSALSLRHEIAVTAVALILCLCDYLSSTAEKNLSRRPVCLREQADQRIDLKACDAMSTVAASRKRNNTIAQQDCDWRISDGIVYRLSAGVANYP